MRIYKISFLFRTPSVGWSYKSANDRELAEDIARAVEEALVPAKPVRSRKSSVQHNFYIAAAGSAEQYKTLVSQALEKLIPDGEIRRQIIISVTEPDSAEMDKLRQTADIGENESFWKAVESCVSAEKKPAVPKPLSVAAEQAVKKLETVTREPAEAEQPQEPVPLSVHTQKLQTLKDALLCKVRGQRHAVDSVVQGIFESEMFSALNPDRKGPLATFLFTGPSGVGKGTVLGIAMDKPYQQGAGPGNAHCGYERVFRQPFQRQIQRRARSGGGGHRLCPGKSPGYHRL